MFITLLFFLNGLLSDTPRIDALRSLIFPYEEGFNIITADSIYYTEDGINFSSEKHDFKESIFRLYYIPHSDDPIYFLASGGGVVYSYQNNQLERLDDSYRWNSRFGATTTSIDDKIYLFGGYGEFAFFDDLLMFDPNLKEWIEVPIAEPRPKSQAGAIFQLDTVNSYLYTGLGGRSSFQNRRDIPEVLLEVGRFNLKDEVYEPLGDLSVLKPYKRDKEVKHWKQFGGYDVPLIFSTKYLIAIDFIENKLFEYHQADLNLLSTFSYMLAYNPRSNRFLLGSDLTDRPRFHVVDEIDLFGRHYTEKTLLDRQPLWIYVLLGLIIIAVLWILLRGRNLLLHEVIIANRVKIQSKLSSDEFEVLEVILKAYPESVEYPELQSAFHKDLSYESRIKKLRTSVQNIDEQIQLILGIRQSIFVTSKGKDDKRVKVIRLNKEVIRVSVFGKFRGSKRSKLQD